MFESPSRLSPPRSFFCCWLMTIIFSSSLWAASNVSWREGGARGWELRKYMHQKVSINKNNSVRYSLLGASPNKNHAVLRLGHGFSVMVWQGSRLCFVGAHEIYLETNNCKEMEPTRWAPYELKMELQALVVSCNYHVCQGCAVFMPEKARFLWFQVLVFQAGLPEMTYRKRIFKGVCRSFLKEFRQQCFIPDTLPKFNIAPEHAWFQLEGYFPFGKEHNASRAMLNFGGAILKKTYPRPSPLDKAFGSSKHT